MAHNYEQQKTLSGFTFDQTTILNVTCDSINNLRLDLNAYNYGDWLRNPQINLLFG
jgi:hypothetical protein